MVHDPLDELESLVAFIGFGMGKRPVENFASQCRSRRRLELLDQVTGQNKATLALLISAHISSL